MTKLSTSKLNRVETKTGSSKYSYRRGSVDMCTSIPQVRCEGMRPFCQHMMRPWQASPNQHAYMRLFTTESGPVLKALASVIRLFVRRDGGADDKVTH